MSGDGERVALPAVNAAQLPGERLSGDAPEPDRHELHVLLIASESLPTMKRICCKSLSERAGS